ncbi:hypothetical protein BC831DRAFT_473179 [Entophlyctis helioformis]|nr:hypothetical protein BC831DRAFT_473179 [Entophlyctis helioformis]
MLRARAVLQLQRHVRIRGYAAATAAVRYSTVSAPPTALHATPAAVTATATAQTHTVAPALAAAPVAHDLKIPPAAAPTLAAQTPEPTESVAAAAAAPPSDPMFAGLGASKRPKGKKNVTATIASAGTMLEKLDVAMETSRLRSAYAIFRTMQLSNSPDLAKISPQTFASLMGIIINNYGAALRDVSSKNRMLRAVELFTLIKSLGIQTNAAIYEYALFAYSRLGNPAACLDTLAEMAERGMDAKSARFLQDVMTAHIIAGDEASGREVFAQLRAEDASINPYNKLLGSFAHVRDERGMLSVLEQMKFDGHRPDSQTYNHLCSFYSQAREFGKVEQYADEFKRDGGQMTPALWGILLRASNEAGDFKKALSIVAEMRVQRVMMNSFSFVEEIVALAATGERTQAWRAFTRSARVSAPKDRVVSAMVKMVGPLTTPEALADLKRTIEVNKLKQVDTLLAMMAGYRKFGDITSVQTILDAITGIASPVELARAQRIVMATYRIAGDIPGVLAFSKETGTAMSFDFCFNILCDALSRKLDGTDMMLEHIRVEFGKDPAEILKAAEANIVRE